ncbi:MAG: carboxypeptidase-like regulatory domain-containing protein, partial [Planctomycetota bacterium]
MSPLGAPVGIVFGRVLDRADRPVEGAQVKLSIPHRRVDAEGKESFSFGPQSAHAATRTDAAGLYRLEVREGGRIQLLVKKDGFEFEAVIRDVLDPPFEERADVVLERKPVATVRGRLLDLSGVPLPAEEIRFLFPDPGAVLSAEGTLVLLPEGETVPGAQRPPQGPSGIWALDMRRAEGPESVEERARIDAERSTFEIEARAGSEAIVAAYFRGDLVAEKEWKGGEDEIEFRLDAQTLRATLGHLEVRGVDASTGAPVPLARGRLRRSGGFAHRVIQGSGKPETRLEGLRAGHYELVASAAGYADGGASVEVTAGALTRLDIPFRRPASIRLRLLPLEGWLPGLGGRDVSFWDLEGRRLGCRSDFAVEGGETFLKTADAPPGGCWVVLEGNAMRLDLSGGENRDLDFPIRRPRLLKVRYRPHPLAIGPTRSLVVTQRLLAEGGVLARNSTNYGGAAPG